MLRNIAQSRSCDMAILFLRLFIGGVMLLHMVGKLQDYDNYVIGFQSILGMNHATSFALTIIFEGLFAVMIVMGVATRVAASLMAIVSIVALGNAFISGVITSDAAKLEFIYMGIYLTLVISGGGRYAMSVILLGGKNVLKR